MTTSHHHFVLLNHWPQEIDVDTAVAIAECVRDRKASATGPWCRLKDPDLDL